MLNSSKLVAITLAILCASSVNTSSVEADGKQKRTVYVPQHSQNSNSNYKIGMTAISTGYSVEVVNVFAGSPASRLQLEPGDRILSVNGVKVRSIPELQMQLRNAACNYNGKIRVLIDNVRARHGEYGAQRYVSHSTYLNGFGPSYKQLGSYNPGYNPTPIITSGK